MAKQFSACPVDVLNITRNSALKDHQLISAIEMGENWLVQLKYDSQVQDGDELQVTLPDSSLVKMKAKLVKNIADESEIIIANG